MLSEPDQPGGRVLVVEDDADIADVLRRSLRNEGYEVKTTDEPEIGRDGKWSFDIYDPDMTRVEFMEYKPAQPPCCNPYSAPHPKP